MLSCRTDWLIAKGKLSKAFWIAMGWRKSTMYIREPPFWIYRN
jgi:hypothetical protein